MLKNLIEKKKKIPPCVSKDTQYTMKKLLLYPSGATYHKSLEATQILDNYVYVRTAFLWRATLDIQVCVASHFVWLVAT